MGKKKQLYYASDDFKNAFDLVHRNGIWYKLLVLFVNWIQDIYILQLKYVFKLIVTCRNISRAKWVLNRVNHYLPCCLLLLAGDTRMSSCFHIYTKLGLRTLLKRLKVYC